MAKGKVQMTLYGMLLAVQEELFRSNRHQLWGVILAIIKALASSVCNEMTHLQVTPHPRHSPTAFTSIPRVPYLVANLLLVSVYADCSHIHPSINLSILTLVSFSGGDRAHLLRERHAPAPLPLQRNPHQRSR